MSVKGFDVTFKTGVKVEFDESVFTQEKIDSFQPHLDSIQEIAEQIAKSVVLGKVREHQMGKEHGYTVCRFLGNFGWVLLDDDTVEDLYATGREWSGIRYRYDDQDFETEIESEYAPK